MKSLQKSTVPLLACGFAACLPLHTQGQVFADYFFQNSLTDSTGNAPDLTVVGVASTSFTTAIVDGVSTSVFGFERGAGLQLDVTGLTDPNRYSIVGLFQLDDAGGYRRILQTQNFTTDHGLYWENSALSFYDEGSGPAGAHQAGRFEQVAFVNDNGALTGYVDGVLQFSLTGDASISADRLLQFFQDDNVRPGESSGGQIARLRIFDNALTGSEVAALDRAATPVPEPETYAMIFGAALTGFALWRRSKR